MAQRLYSIAVSSPDECRRVQKLLFSRGFEWRSGREVKHEGASVITVWSDGSIKHAPKHVGSENRRITAKEMFTMPASNLVARHRLDPDNDV